MGDAACAFNPVYAQGMTAAALGAVTLDQCLSEQRKSRHDGELSGLAWRFQQKLAKVNAVPWMLATSEDCRFCNIQGGRLGWATQLMHWYMDQIMELSTRNTSVCLVFLEIMQMLKPPSALFHSRIIAQVLRQALELTFHSQEREL
jgi:2-polyprenyl-6-methoxyphenol hydroxylase-like FAD-dependent oxidoreductase